MQKVGELTVRLEDSERERAGLRLRVGSVGPRPSKVDQSTDVPDIGTGEKREPADGLKLLLKRLDPNAELALLGQKEDDWIVTLGDAIEKLRRQVSEKADAIARFQEEHRKTEEQQQKIICEKGRIVSSPLRNAI